MKKVPTTNNHEGYIPIFRRFLENELWLQKRKFSRAEAWIDLLFMARYKEEESTIIDRGEVIKVGYGEILTSILTLSDRWKRSRVWTYSLLKFLTTDGSIICNIKDKRRTTIKIVKLGYFRDLIKKKTTEKTTVSQKKDIRKTTEKTTEKTYKNKDIKKDIKNKEDTTKVVSRRKPYGNERIGYILEIFRRDFDQPPVDKYPRRVAWAFVQNIQSAYKKKTGKDVTDDNFKRISDWIFSKYISKDFAENTYKLETVRLHSKAFLEKVLEGGGKNG